jgi:hypothetical protein
LGYSHSSVQHNRQFVLGFQPSAPDGCLEAGWKFMGWSLVLPGGKSLVDATIILSYPGGGWQSIWQAPLFQATSAAYMESPAFAAHMEEPRRLSMSDKP